MEQDLIIEWGEWSELINERFIPLVENRDRYLVLYGGRGSSKSDFAAKKLIFRCINEPYFLYMLIRNKYNSIKESSYETVKQTIITLGLAEFFEFKVSPLEIICRLNGNRFIARGCDDTTSIKSVKDPTGAWYEEDIISSSDFITITSSIRTSRAEYLQEIFSINPEVKTGDYTQNWLWKRFFEGHDELSFSSKTSVDIGNGETVSNDYTVMHSTYRDNRWIRPESLAEVLSMKESNPYYYTVYTLGRWGNKVLGGTFFKTFQISRNTAKVEYNPKLPLVVSFDFNVKPGVSCGIFQKKDKTLYMVDEIQLKSPNNNTTAVCREICRRYCDHKEGMTVTADASGRQEDTRSEKGHNDIRIIIQELRQFRPNDRVPALNPPVAKSKEFINDVFEGGDEGYKGVRIIIGDHCTKMIADLLYLLEDTDGTALKKTFKDPETGDTYEQYGHFADLFRYAVVEMFPYEFRSKLRGFTGLNITYGKNVSRNKY
jgi:PBSX family phage terminase large subunit